MILRFALLAALTALGGTGAPSSEQLARIESLEQRFLAPCCWAEPIAHHRSEIALQMKAEIGRWVAEGKSDREIIDTYAGRYGARILVEPEGVRRWWLNVIPWVVVALGLVFTIVFLRRMSGRRDLSTGESSAGE